MSPKYIDLEFIISDYHIQLIKEIAIRRYGDDSIDHQGQVVDDAIHWRDDKIVESDNWLLMIWYKTFLTFPITVIRAYAWGKFIMPYFKDMKLKEENK
jgi:hypothetical protein